MKYIKKRFKAGVHTIALPISEEMDIEQLFPKELSGSTIEKLNNKGQWSKKEIVLFQNNGFEVSDFYRRYSPFDTIRLNLKRDIVIEWELKFRSYSGLKNYDINFELGFEWEEALYLSQLSDLVYKDEEFMKKNIQEKYDFDEFYYYSKQSHKKLINRGFDKLLMTFLRGKKSIVDLQFMYLSKIDKNTGKNLIVVVFQGSQEAEDWMTNFNLKSESFMDRGTVHKGFYHALQLFFQTIKKQDFSLSKKVREAINKDIEKLNEDTTIMLTGHSLGGALATLTGCYLYELGFDPNSLEIYTFGAPPIGTKDFCTYYQDKLEVYRLVNEYDVVPKLDKMSNFFHLGNEIVLPSNQGELHACKGYIDNIIDRIEIYDRKS